MSVPRLIQLAACMLAMSAGVAAQQGRTPSSPPASAWQISGTVISSADGQPLSRTQVALSSNRDPNLGQEALTGADGRFLFRGLAAGKYVLRAKHYGFVTQGYQQRGEFFTGIAVGPGLAPPSLLFRLQPEAVISGRIVDEAGDPVRDARVMLLHKSLQSGEWATRVSNSTVSDDRGFYHFDQLLPGRYFVSVNTQPWYTRLATGASAAGEANTALDVAYPITWYQDATDAGDATPLDLQAGEQATADVTLTAVPAQHIVVRMADDTAVTGFTAMLSRHVAEAGNFSVSTFFHKVAPGVFQSSGVPPGSYEMELNFYDPKSGRQGAVQRRTVEVDRDAEVDLSAPSAAAPVSGTVSLIPALKPPPHLFLTLRNLQSQESHAAEISARRSFRFTQNIPPGRYEFGSSFAGGFYVVSAQAAGATVEGRTLRITASEPVVLKVVMTQGVAQVTGTVVRDGKPVAGALVVLVPPDPANNSPLFRVDQSDSDGTFTLPSIVPGRYTVLAIENGWGLEWHNPAALKPYLPRGEALEIAREGRYKIKLAVQDF